MVNKHPAYSMLQLSIAIEPREAGHAVAFDVRIAGHDKRRCVCTPENIGATVAQAVDDWQAANAARAESETGAVLEALPAADLEA